MIEGYSLPVPPNAVQCETCDGAGRVYVEGPHLDKWFREPGEWEDCGECGGCGWVCEDDGYE